MIESDQLHFLDQTTQITLSELLTASGLSLGDLRVLAEYGVFDLSVDSVDTGSSPRDLSELRVAAHALHVARRAVRLQRDFGLDAAGIAVALSLLERIDRLEEELRHLRCHFGPF